jgi:hypothetical protein
MSNDMHVSETNYFRRCEGNVGLLWTEWRHVRRYKFKHTNGYSSSSTSRTLRLLG